MSTASSVRFSELSGLLERISRTKKSNEKQSLLNSFNSKWREYSHNNKNSTSVNSVKYRSFYPAMRLIIPSMDKHRPSYGIKEFSLAKLYCDFLCLGNNPDAKKLMNFRSPKYNESGASDFAETAYEILKKRSPTKGSISIEEVNNRLDRIAEANGQSKKKEINDSLMYLFQNTNALDQKWLIRIILKDLSIGLVAKTIFKCIHPSSEDLYNVTNDLEAVCDKFQSSDENFGRFDIRLFQPFKPMLSNRGDIQNILVQMEFKEFIHEIKFDGERVQLHKNGSHYRYWSRNGLEWTNSYGKDPTSGTLTPFIHNQFKSTLENCILDGEMMGYHMATQSMGSKAEAFDIKSINVEKSGYMPCFVVFDVLYINDKILTHQNLLERKRVLDNEILDSELRGKIQIAKWTQISTREECLEAFNGAIENCEEGLMVKKIDSIYKVNCRATGWFKMKPDYVLGLHEEIDCVIVGGYFGKGNLIQHFLCAVKSDNDTNQYLSFTKVGTGFTRKVLYEFNMKMACNWNVYNQKNHPSWLVLAGKFREKPDIYIEPDKSFIVQLKAAEIMASESFATRCTLRFARIDCFREDKSPLSDCMTVNELNKLRSAHKGKLALHPLTIHSEDEDMSMEKFKKVSKKRTSRKRHILPENLKSTVPVKKMTDDNSVTRLFSGKEFCILLANVLDKTYDKKQLESFVYDNGGVVVQNPSRSTFGVIVNKVTVKVQNLMKTNQYDIISADWLIHCMNKKEFIDLKPVDFFGMKEETAKYLGNLFDKTGDSYTNELTVNELITLLDNMDMKLLKISELSPRDRSLFIDEMMINDMESTYLNGCVIFFYIPLETDCSASTLSVIDRLKCKVTLAGATIANNIEQLSISHVVFIRTDDIQKLGTTGKTLNERWPRDKGKELRMGASQAVPGHVGRNSNSTELPESIRNCCLAKANINRGKITCGAHGELLDLVIYQPHESSGLLGGPEATFPARALV